jgi:phenylacetate-CoA ligase
MSSEMMSDKPYWNEVLETMFDETLFDLESKRLKTQISRIFQVNDFYRDKWQQAGVDLGDIQDLDDLHKLPFTEKTELADAQKTGALLGANQSVELCKIMRIVGTGGTTGQPLRLGLTKNDLDAYSEMGARALWAMGCRPDDFVINCFNYSLYAGGTLDQSSFEKLGAAILPYGVGNTNRLLQVMGSIKQDICLYSTPSYAIHLAERAQEIGMSPQELNITKGFFSGEAGLQVPDYRQKIETTWGMSAADLYGAAEVGAQSGECEHRTGLHFFGQGLLVAELINPKTLEVVAKTDGAIGELVFTTLMYEACPLIRFRTHDSVQVFTEPCTCGRTGFRFHTLGRSDDMFVVKGVNVFPSGVQKALLSLQPQVTGEFYIVLNTAPPIDYSPLICVEVLNEIDASSHAGIIYVIKVAIREQLGFRAIIKLVKRGSIASMHKTRRLYRTYDGDRPPHENDSRCEE